MKGQLKLYHKKTTTKYLKLYPFFTSYSKSKLFYNTLTYGALNTHEHEQLQNQDKNLGHKFFSYIRVIIGQTKKKDDRIKNGVHSLLAPDKII